MLFQIHYLYRYTVCSIITNLDEGSNVFFRQLDELNKFMAEKRLPHELRVKLRDYFRFRRNCRAMVEWSSVMHLMSVGPGGLCRAGTYPKWHARMLAKVPKMYPKLPKITCSDAGESIQNTAKYP